MDYVYFLQIRTRFIRRFYEDAAAPFLERKRKIEAGEEPFDAAPAFEADEPPYLEEWSEADEALDVLGQTCVSLLAASLQLYVKGWLRNWTRGSEELIQQDQALKAAFKQGWVNGYRVLFRGHLGIDWGTGPSDIRVLEEIVLARNATQHPTSITTMQVKQPEGDAARYPRSFFADDFELRAFTPADDPTAEPFWPVRLNITREKLFAALDEVNAFCAWLDQQETKSPTPATGAEGAA